MIRTVNHRQLPVELRNELHALWIRLAIPLHRQRLLREQLTLDEVELLMEGQGVDLEDLADRVSSGEILRVVAEQRGWTRERTLLDLALGIDSIGPGLHQRLRREIGEPLGSPVTAVPDAKESPTTPRWDRNTGKLHFGAYLIGKFRILRRPSRAQKLLDTFEKLHWSSAIEQPFGGDVTFDRVHSAVHELNKTVEMISFHVQAGATQITWDLKPK